MLHLKCCIKSINIDTTLKQNTLTVSGDKFKIVSVAASIANNIVLFLSSSRFPVKLIYCIAFGSVSSAVYLNLSQLAYNIF